MDSIKSGASGKGYEKPRLRIIELKSEEVLAAGCKNDSSTDVGSSLDCNPGSCSELGS